MGDFESDFYDETPHTEQEVLLLSVLAELERAMRVRDEAIAARDESYNELSRVVDEAQEMFNETERLKSELKRAKSSGANDETLAHVQELTLEVEALKRKAAMDARELDQIRVRISADETVYLAKIAYLDTQLAFEQTQTRQLRAKVAELKGNVRVIARVRPFLPMDCVGPEADPSVLALSDGESVKVIRADKTNKEDSTFRFDRSLGPNSNQTEVFAEVAELVQSALDGYNVCVFSYGQTGSGGSDDSRGIIPRAIQLLGQVIHTQGLSGWVYQTEATYVEIYNESVRDLLRESSADIRDHEIKRDVDGSIIVADATVIQLDPEDETQIIALLMKANTLRSSGSTNMNEESSRSHSVLTLRMMAVNDKEALQLHGSLSLVDLAGSERLDRSGATGSSAKEAIAINKSLSALADVFLAIRKKDSHIPYRNSKLTSLLQPALGGDGRTLMLIALSPTEASSFESFSSCRFATQVNKCELGKPRKGINDLSSLRTEDAERIEQLTQQLEAAKAMSSRRPSVNTTVAHQRNNNKIRL